MKSLYHILALKCDFGADTSLFRPAEFPRNSIIACPLTDNVANLHYNNQNGGYREYGLFIQSSDQRSLKEHFFNAYMHKVVKTWPWQVLKSGEYCSLRITAVIQSSCCSQSWQNNLETENLDPTLGKMPDLVAWSPVAARLRREKDFPVVNEANFQSSEGYQLSFVGWAAADVMIFSPPTKLMRMADIFSFCWKGGLLFYASMLVSELWPVKHLMCRVSTLASERIVTEVALTQWLVSGGTHHRAEITYSKRRIAIPNGFYV